MCGGCAWMVECQGVCGVCVDSGGAWCVWCVRGPWRCTGWAVRARTVAVIAVRAGFVDWVGLYLGLGRCGQVPFSIRVVWR